jgi:hypothetical protein
MITSATTNIASSGSFFGARALSSRVGSVAFDYGVRSYPIGVSLDEAEARLLIQQMKRWLLEGAVASSSSIS